MAFSDTIESSMLTSVYVSRATVAPDSSGNYGTGVTTVTSGMKGDVQPASRWLYHPTGAGVDYLITHIGFFDVPGTVPAVSDTLVDGSTNYAVRNVRDFKTHLELDLERLGQ